MANIKISELPAASAASTSQEFEVNDSSTSKKVTGSQIKSFVKSDLVLTDITDVTVSVAELNTLDGITATAAELNVLDGASTSQAPLILAQPSAFIDPENRIINGAFDFWQRGTSSTAAGYVAADRWQNIRTGGTVTQSRQTFAVGETLGLNNPTYFLRQTVSGQTLADHLAHISHTIEDVRSYASQTITVLGWAKRSSGAGNMVLETYQSFGTGGSPSPLLLVSANTITLTDSFAPFAVVIAVPSIAGKTLGTNSNDNLGFNFFTSAGSNLNARTNSLGLQTIGVDLWGIHIKVGTHTTDAVNFYKAPELGPELVRCQRYYVSDSGIDMLLRGYDITNGGNIQVYFPTSMRAVPSLTATNNTSGTVTTTAIGSRKNGFGINCKRLGSDQYFGLASFTADAEL